MPDSPENLHQNQSLEGAPDETPQATAPPSSAATAATVSTVNQDEIEALVSQTAAALDQNFASTVQPAPPAPAGGAPAATAQTAAQQPATAATPFVVEKFDAVAAKQADGKIEMLDDVELDIRIELGRTEMYIEDVLRLHVDSVIELDKLAGDPVDVYIDNQLIARGEVLVLNDSFCVRINDILSPIPELAEDSG